MDAAPAPVPASPLAPDGRAPRLRAAALAIAAQGSRIVDAWCASIGAPGERSLVGLAWLAGPVATTARLRQLADVEELSASGKLFESRDFVKRGDVLTVELRPRTGAERRLYRDGAIRFVLDASSPLEVLGAIPSHPPDSSLDVRDPVTEEILAPLADAGLVRLARSPGSSAGESVAIVLPALHAKDELVYVARRLAGEITARRAFGLPGPTVILVATYWPQRARFVELLTQALAMAPAPFATRVVHDAEASEIQETIRIEGLGSHEAPAFLAVAVTRANELGAASVEIVAHVLQEEDPVIEAAIDRAVAELQASTIGVNEWPEMARLRGVVPRIVPRARKTVVHGLSYRSRLPLYVQGTTDPSVRGERLLAFHAGPSFARRVRARP